MIGKNNNVYEQEKVFYNSLNGTDKRNYYVATFLSELVFALKDKRKEKRMTQENVARLMGMKQVYISKIENLQKKPTIETIAKYMYAVGVTFEEVKCIPSILIEECDAFPDCSKLFNISVQTAAFMGKDDADDKKFQNYKQSSMNLSLSFGGC